MAKLIEMLTAMAKGEIDQPPVAKLVGFKLIDVEAGRSRFDMETGPQHYNPMGTVHGGILCDIADAAMGVAFASTLDDGESFTTVDLQISYLRPCWEEHLTAIGHVIKRGKHVGLVECEVKNSDGKLVAKASSHCMVLRGDLAEGR